MKQSEYIPIKEAVQRLDSFSHKTQYCINAYCLNGKIDCVRVSERWYINRALIERALQWRSSVIPVEELLAQYVQTHTPKDPVNFLRVVKNRICSFYINENIPEAVFFPGPFVSKGNKEKVLGILEEEYMKRETRENLVPVKIAADKMGISVYILKNMIKKGTIQAERAGQHIYLSEKEIRRFLQQQTQYIGVIDLLEDEVLPNVSTVWDIAKRPNRNTLILYLKSNPQIMNLLVTWETAGLHGDRRNAYYFPAYAKEKIKRELVAYLEGYGIKQERLDMYMQDTYWASHPINKEVFDKFSEGKHIIGLAAVAEMMVKAMPKEITQCSNDDIKEMLEYAQKAKTNIFEAYAVMLVRFVQDNYNPVFTIRLSYSKTIRNRSINTDAYSRQEYYQIAVMTFNAQYIKTHRMLEKAFADEHYAALWLYCSWLFVGAWRRTDIFGSLPVLETPSQKEVVIQQIRQGIYGQEAVMLSVMLEAEIMDKMVVPSKTRKYKNQRKLTVVIPEVLREIIGTIYAINCVHHSGKSYFPVHNFHIKDFSYFFGPEYTEIFGNSVISVRRANKAFLSNVAETVENMEENKAMGYAVAGYARSHTNAGIKDSLPRVTARYLRHELDGMSQDEVLMLMFETGTCSFIPYLLMKVVYGQDFIKLPVNKQNVLLKDNGMDADQAEGIILAVTKNYALAEKTVGELTGIANTAKQREKVRQVLEHILDRSAMARQSCMCCLRMAARQPCAFPIRESCIGCKYGIMEKGILFTLFKQIENRIHAIRTAKTTGEKKKLKMVLEESEVPALYEILFALKEIYHADITIYLEQFKKLLKDG